MPARSTLLGLLLIATLACLSGLWVTWGCQDYDVTDGDDPDAVDDDDDSSPAADDDDDDATGDDDDVTEPEPTLDECPEGVTFAWEDDDGDGYIAVVSGDPEDHATITVSVSATYHIYDLWIAESGAEQLNETGYITIANSANPDGLPEVANCGSLYVVADSDNNGQPPQAMEYLGTFQLVAGEDNALTLHHYCPLYQDGWCPQFHNGDPDSGSGCNTGNANSIHMTLEGICLVPI